MPPKRKSSSTQDAPPRRSTRQRTSTTSHAPTTAGPARASSSSSPPKAAKAAKRDTKNKKVSTAKSNATTSTEPANQVDTESTANVGAPEPQYWLMKAEPETRYENGVDVSFSIDDLAAKTDPEPWDGIRNYVARNNLRAMKQGDLAFFSHSNCKEPGIVGTMEIVREHEPDLSAHDPKSAYYDAKSTASAPKWSVVHVVFRRKFAAPITLKEMRAHAGPGGPLEGMQMMKQSRLSVSRVAGAEWEFLMGLADAKGKGES